MQSRSGSLGTMVIMACILSHAPPAWLILNVAVKSQGVHSHTPAATLSATFIVSDTLPRIYASPGQEPAWTEHLGAISESWSYDAAGLCVTWGGGTFYRCSCDIQRWEEAPGCELRGFECCHHTCFSDEVCPNLRG